MHIKAVVVIGDYETQANTINWYITVGTNDDPFTNTKFPPTVSVTPNTLNKWAKEVKIGAWGDTVSIVTASGTTKLVLGFAGIFASLFACGETN